MPSHLHLQAEKTWQYDHHHSHPSAESMGERKARRVGVASLSHSSVVINKPGCSPGNLSNSACCAVGMMKSSQQSSCGVEERFLKGRISGLWLCNERKY